MSKDFEQAYKELAQIEVPDLWDRIEAGLKEKTAPEETAKKYTPGKERNRKKLLAIRRYSGAIAAAVCVAVVLPAAVLIKQSSKGYSGGAMESAEKFSVTEESIEESADTGSTNETAILTDAGEGNDKAMSADDAADEMAAAPMEAGQGNAKEESMDEAADTDMADMADARTGAGDVSENERGLESQAVAEKKSQSIQVTPLAGEVFEHVGINVVELEEDFYREKAPGVLCTVTFLQSLPGIRDGEQAIIYVPSDLLSSLYKDGEFEVDLRYQEEEDYSFVLEKIYQ